MDISHEQLRTFMDAYKPLMRRGSENCSLKCVVRVLIGSVAELILCDVYSVARLSHQMPSPTFGRVGYSSTMNSATVVRVAE